jgi:hypothetical protein
MELIDLLFKPKLTRRFEMKIKLGQVPSIREACKQLPPIENKDVAITKSRAIKLLEGEIKHLQKIGYTFQQIADFLTQQGLPIKASTINKAMRVERKKRPLNPKTELAKNSM